METVNWVKEKGALPYYYHRDPYKEKHGNAEFEILSPEDSSIVKQYLKSDRKITEKLEMCHSVWQFHLLENLASTHLIADLNGKQRLTLNLGNRPLTIYLTYPFLRVAKVTIPPIRRRWNNTKIERFFTVGYIFWQLAKVYADIYKNHWQEVGIKEFGLSDLFFEDCYIGQNGKGDLFMGC